MSQYMIGMYYPEGPTPPAEVLDEVMRRLDEMNGELRTRGQFVFSGGLTAASSATVVRTRDGEPALTDGPFVEGKEHLGGFWIVDVADLDEALAIARRASEITTLPHEVRAFNFAR